MFRRRSSRGAAESPGPPGTDAFASDVLAFLEPLYATALRLTRNRADAEDLVQDTFVKAFRFSERYQRGTNLKAWLYTILHNTWRNRRRDASRDTVDVDSERVEEAASLPGGPALTLLTRLIPPADCLDHRLATFPSRLTVEGGLRGSP